MAALRVPPNRFDRWARSESGLHLPSRFVPRVAKRLHHIQKMGTTKDCCAPSGPCEYCGYLESAYDVTFTGFADSETPAPGGCAGNITFTGCACLNATFRVPWYGWSGPVGNDWACSGDFTGGCVWSDLFYDCVLTYDYDDGTCRDGSQGPYVWLHVKPGSGSGLIDVEVLVGFQFQTHIFLEKDVECGSGCLDGLQVSACGSGHLDGSFAFVSGGAGCAESGVSGYCTIDAVP